MENDTLIYLYIYGVAVSTLVYAEKATVYDCFVSFITSIFWPIGLPAMIFKKLFR